MDVNSHSDHTTINFLRLLRVQEVQNLCCVVVYNNIRGIIYSVMRRDCDLLTSVRYTALKINIATESSFNSDNSVLGSYNNKSFDIRPILALSGEFKKMLCRKRTRDYATHKTTQSAVNKWAVVSESVTQSLRIAAVSVLGGESVAWGCKTTKHN